TQVFHVARHGTDLPEGLDPAAGGWEVTGARQAAGGGLDGGDATEGGGQADATGGFAAQAEGRAAAGDERGLAATGAAGGAGGVVGIAGGTEQEVVALECKEQIGEIGAGDGDGAGVAEAGDQGGIAGGRQRGAASQGAGGTDGSGELDRILDAERNATQRTGGDSLGDGPIGGVRGGERRRGEHLDDGMNARVYGGDASQVRLHQFDRRDAALADQSRLVSGGEGEDFEHGDGIP